MKEKNKRTKKNDRLTSIRGRLQSDITRLMGISILILAVILVALNLYSTINALKNDLSTMASITAARVSQELMVTSRVATELGAVASGSGAGPGPARKAADGGGRTRYAERSGNMGGHPGRAKRKSND